MKPPKVAWQHYTLDDIAEKVDYGHTASAADKPVGPRFLRITDIQNGTVHWESVPYCVCSEQDIRDSALATGDIVFARTGATTGKSFLIDAIPEPSIFASYLIRLRLKSGYEPRLLAYYFQTEDYWSQIKQHSQGATLPGVNATKLRSLKVSLPTDEREQRRIADILDEADALRRKRVEAIRLADHLVPSLFHEMFGDPQLNPHCWPIEQISKHTIDSQYGTADKANDEGRGFPVLRMNNIRYDGTVDIEDIKWCEIPTADISAYTVRRGDLLFNRTNSRELVGKTAVWDRDEQYAFAGYLVRFRFDENNLLPAYVSAVLNSTWGKRVLLSRAKPSVNMSNINATEFGRIKIPIPPRSLQQSFADNVAAVRMMSGPFQQSKLELDNLFHSLLQRAFQGEL